MSAFLAADGTGALASPTRQSWPVSPGALSWTFRNTRDPLHPPSRKIGNEYLARGNSAVTAERQDFAAARRGFFGVVNRIR